MEIERKFLIRELPESLLSQPYRHNKIRLSLSRNRTGIPLHKTGGSNPPSGRFLFFDIQIQRLHVQRRI